MLRVFLFFLCGTCFLASCTQTKTTATAGGLSAQEAVTTFRLPDGFKIELVASEPLVTDPVAMEVDEAGRMYVVEMHGYPLDTSGTGAVKLLQDTNGDGQPDKSITFADHLKLPTGIMRWKRGILVVDVPDVLYFEDTTGDGRADVRQVVLTGMALTNPQHIANTPLFGLDNWIYLAHMGTVTPKVSMEFIDSGSNVRFVNAPGAPQLPRNADGRNIRFKPDTHELEMLSGETQYGQTFDAWGHHLGTDNSHHLFHEVIGASYLQRNPNLLVGAASAFIPDHGDAAEVYPITKNPEHQLLTDVGIVTSSCGVTWYNGGLFPDSFYNITFIAEPVHNLVHADRITNKGATFKAARVYEKKEFLASTDGWFRPVQFYIGPDGALYVLDYYRQIVEHPEWMSDSVNQSGALYNGSDRGRIYRITPTAAGPMDWCDRIPLAKASTQDLVQALASSNIWWRRNAQRLLLDQKNAQTPALLHQLLDTTKSPLATVHALWALEGFNALDDATLKKALQHPTAGVRENAVRLAELYLQQWPDLQNKLLALQNDADAKVRFQLLCTLGAVNSTDAESARQKLLLKDIEDPWVQVAALTSSAGNEYAMIQKAIPAFAMHPTEGKKLFFQNCASVIGLSQRVADIQNLIQLATTSKNPASGWWQAACLEGLTTALANKGKPAADFSAAQSLLLRQFDPSTPAPLRTAAIHLLSRLGTPDNKGWKEVIAKAIAVATNKQSLLDYRNDAVRLLALDRTQNNTALLTSLLTPDEPESIQQTALLTFNAVAGKEACAAIVHNWNTLSPGVRDVAMTIFLSSIPNMHVLLDAVQKEQIQPSAISWPQMVELMNNDDNGIRNRSRDLLVPALQARDVVYKNYQSALQATGDTAKGRLVFQRVCGTCHQVSEQFGHAFGPDLGSIRNRDAGSIMADILNPNRSIADKYELWTIQKKNGAKEVGIISSETPTAVTVRYLGGKEVLVPRSEIRSMEASSTSAMPVGLEGSLSVNDMAHLLAFLKNVH